jgi:hypothetical protein
MSYFIVSIDFAGLSDRPPESNVMPLPTTAMRRRPRAPPSGTWRSVIRRGSSALPRATASRPVNPSFAMRPGPHTSARSVGDAAARRWAYSAMKVGVATDGGSFTRSRVPNTPRAMLAAPCRSFLVVAGGGTDSPTMVRLSTRGPRRSER